MKFFSFFLLVNLFVVSQFGIACNVSSDNTPNRARNSSAIQSNSGNKASSTVPNPLNEIKTYRGVGIITLIREDGGEVELNHEEIKGVMPAMQMMFHVKNKADLKNLKVGDKVDFILEDNQGAEQIAEIQKR